jgi:hypothetical protein
MGIMKNSAGNAIYSCRSVMSVNEGTLTAGNSPVTCPVSANLGGGTNRGNAGYIANDGSGSIQVEIAQEGTSYMSPFTLKSGENFDVTGMNISNVRLTRLGADANYRVVIW